MGDKAFSLHYKYLVKTCRLERTIFGLICVEGVIIFAKYCVLTENKVDTGRCKENKVARNASELAT